MSNVELTCNGRVLEHYPDNFVDAGEIVVIGDVVGQVRYATKAGDKSEVYVDGVVEAPKLLTDEVSPGQTLYWDAANNRCTLTQSTHKRIGHAFSFSSAEQTSVLVRLSCG